MKCQLDEIMSVSKLVFLRTRTRIARKRWYFFETRKLLNQLLNNKLFAEHGLLNVRFLGVHGPALRIATAHPSH